MTKQEFKIAFKLMTGKNFNRLSMSDKNNFDTSMKILYGDKTFSLGQKILIPNTNKKSGRDRLCATAFDNKGYYFYRTTVSTFEESKQIFITFYDLINAFINGTNIYP